MEVAVPPGCAGGSVVEVVDAAGCKHSAVVPDGLVEGDVFTLIVENPAPPPWLDDILEALTQDRFASVLASFVDRECKKFLTSDGGHSLEQTQVHSQYVRIYESRIESLLRKHGVTSDEFMAALLAADLDGSSLAASLLVVQDFQAFAAMCAQGPMSRRMADMVCQ